MIVDTRLYNNKVHRLGKNLEVSVGGNGADDPEQGIVDSNVILIADS